MSEGMNGLMGDNDEMQREWRHMVLTRLEGIQSDMRVIQQTLGEMGGKYVSIEDFKDTTNKMQAKIDSLEKDKAKIIGFVLAVQTFAGIAFAIYNIVKSAH